jgi:hypothetical protein
MKSVEDAIAFCFTLLEGNRSRSKAGIARDLEGMGCSPANITEQLEAFDDEFDAAIERALPAVREQIEAALREPSDDITNKATRH